MSSKTGWAQLVCSTDAVIDPVHLSSNKFTIGRAKSCDLCLSGNKLVSGQHCFVEKDADGKVWLQDTSTNGTLVNMNHKVSHGQRRQLVHGDEIYLVYRKNDTDLNVAYLYQDLAELEKEQMDATQEYSSDVDTGINEEPLDLSAIVTRKRTFVHSTSADQSSLVSTAPSSKRNKTEDEISTNQEAPDTKVQSTANKISLCKSGRSSQKAEGDLDTKEAATPKDGEGTTHAVGTGSEKVAESDPGKEDKGEPGKDEFEETLICIICQEILHDCISLQPCMHSFCAGCYSDWMGRSNECPSCRIKVERINKNHLVNNLVQAYLSQHSEKRRPEEDLKELDAKNKITKDMLYPKKKKVPTATLR